MNLNEEVFAKQEADLRLKEEMRRDAHAFG
jgi:hypothetical protein